MFCKELSERDFLQAGETHNLQNLVQAVGLRVFLLGDGDEQVGADRSPDLNADPVGFVAEKPTQAQVLFDPSEKQFDLPAAPVNLGDRHGGQVKGVCEEDEGDAALGIPITDPSKRIGVVVTTSGRVQSDGLVAPQACGLVYRPGPGDVEARVALGPGDEEGTGLVDAVAPPAVTRRVGV